MSLFAPLDLRIATPRLELHGASDELLERLVPIVRAGGAMADPPPWDDPCVFYESDPDVRVREWLRSIWRGRSTVSAERWRLYFVVMVDGHPVGQQDLTGVDFEAFRTVESTSWIAPDHRRSGFGTEMRAAILHLAFAGFGAAEAHSEAAMNNAGSNGVSERLGYERNGTAWATHRGEPVLGQRWRLSSQTWAASHRRDDISISGLEACLSALGVE